MSFEQITPNTKEPGKKTGVTKPEQTSDDFQELQEAFPGKEFSSAKVGAGTADELQETLREMRTSEDSRRKRYEELKRKAKEEDRPNA